MATIGVTKQPSQGDPDQRATERDLLLGWLAFHRDALARNCAGLSAAQLVQRPAPPSDLSLLGLVRHLTEMEHWYVEGALAEHPVEPLYCPYDDPDGDILGLDESMAEASMSRWREQMAVTDGLLAGGQLDDPSRSGRSTVRWCVVKVLQEYARHNGHADLIRERIDGATGE